MAVRVRGVARTKRDRKGRRAYRSDRCCCLESGDGETWGDRVDATGGLWTRSVSPTDVATSRSEVDSKRFRLASRKCHLSSVAVKWMENLDSSHTVQCTSNGRLLWCNYVKWNIWLPDCKRRKWSRPGGRRRLGLSWPIRWIRVADNSDCNVSPQIIYVMHQRNLKSWDNHF